MFSVIFRLIFLSQIGWTQTGPTPVTEIPYQRVDSSYLAQDDLQSAPLFIMTEKTQRNDGFIFLRECRQPMGQQKLYCADLYEITNGEWAGFLNELETVGLMATAGSERGRKAILVGCAYGAVITTIVTVGLGGIYAKMAWKRLVGFVVIAAVLGAFVFGTERLSLLGISDRKAASVLAGFLERAKEDLDRRLVSNSRLLIPIPEGEWQVLIRPQLMHFRSN